MFLPPKKFRRDERIGLILCESAVEPKNPPDIFELTIEVSTLELSMPRRCALLCIKGCPAKASARKAFAPPMP